MAVHTSQTTPPTKPPLKEVTYRRTPLRSILDISVIIPIRDERQAILGVIEQVTTVLEDMGHRFEVLIIDDGSMDGSFEHLRSVCNRDERVGAVRLARPSGKAAALAAGFSRARGRVIVTLDGDGQDDPASIPDLVRAVWDGTDVACGWRKTRRDSWLKRYVSKFFNGLVRLLFGLSLHDINCGMKAYRREATTSLVVYGGNYRYLPILAHFHGLTIQEVPVRHHPRLSGQSKYGSLRLVAGFIDLWTVWFLTRFGDRPAYFFGGLGSIFGLVGFSICTYIVVLKLYSGTIQSRYPLLALGVLLIILGVQFFTTGFLAELMTAIRKGNTLAESATIRECIGCGS